MKQNLFCLFLFLAGDVLFGHSFAQTKLPDVIPPSPQSRAFQRYGEYPVNYNTGIPDISIPLYTIKSGGLEVPIILKYYASGIKPYEPDMSNVGSGWILDIGGLVTRTVEGKADELFAKQYPMKSPSQINQENESDIYYLDNILKDGSGNDSRYDRFAYSFGDRHGSFAIEDDQAGNFKAYPYPFVPYKINVHTAAPTSSNYYKSISGIDITDDNGINYQFGYNNTESTGHDYYNYVTGWYLEKVADPANINQINFTYEDVPVFSWGTNTGSVQIKDNGVVIGLRPCDQQTFPTNISGINSVDYSGASYSTKNIKTITFNNGRIEFTTDASKRHIISMVIFNNDNTLLRTISFNQDNFPGSLKQFRLNSLQISNGVSPVEQYTFSYDLSHPVTDDNCLIDQWGYCRGEGGNATKTMRRTIQSITSLSSQSQPFTSDLVIGDQLFTPNEEYAKRYILNKIQYPTGGSSEFIYELNKYFDVSTQTGGGLRVKQIISKDGFGNSLLKSYEYEPGFLEYPLSRIEYSTRCNFNLQFQCMADEFSPTYYVYRNRTLANGWNGDLGSNGVFYNKVTEYTGDVTANSGKIIYTYSYENPNQQSISNISSGVKGLFMPNYYMQTYKNWGNGLLKSKEIFKNIGNNSYSKVGDLVNNYTFVNQKTLNGLYVYIVAAYPSSGTDLISINQARNDLAVAGYDKAKLLQGASVNLQNIVTGAYYLSSTIENKYEDNKTLTTNTIYEHGNPNHYYPTKIIKDLSTNEKSVTTLAYVDEFGTNPIYSSMKNLNILAPVIEKKDYIRNVSNTDRFISGVKTDYKQWNNIAEYLPQTVQTATVENAYQPRLSYNNYDTFGNITSVSQAAGSNKVYLWSYNNQFPVFEISNESYSSVEAALGGATAVKNFSASIPSLSTINSMITSLKSALPNAHIATYTYSPLVGITSTTDVKGTKTSYEYDQLQRLINIKNKDNNIIKHIDYHYQGQ